jgi:trimeric autotransporter adhesin
MSKQLLIGTIAVVVMATAGQAAAAPGIVVAPLPIGGNSMRADGGMPGEDQYGSYGITNTGTTTLTVTNMTLTGAGAGVISYSDDRCGQGTTCPQTFALAPGAQTSFTVLCVAPQPGQFSATLTVTSNAASGSGTAALTCRGFHAPVIQVAPSGLDFGTQHVCWQGDACGPRCATQPATQTLTITNTAADPSELDLAAALPANGPLESFTITSDQQAPYVLGAGQSVVVTLTYHPQPPATVNFDGPVALTPIYPPGLGQLAVPLHAHGGSGQFQMDSPVLLGTGPVGQPLIATITGHSSSDSCIDLDEAGFEGPGDITVLDPQVDHQHPLLLQAGEQVTWQVSCTPTQVAEICESFDLNWSYDDPETGAQYTFCCQGDGGVVAASVTPASYGFGTVALPATPSQRFRLDNPGQVALTVHAVTLDLPNDYTVTGLAAGATIDPGATLTFDVRATPSMLGARQATLAIDLDRAPDLAIPLDALATDPALVVTTGDASPADYALELGNVDVDVGPKAGHVTLHNAGATPITLATCALSGDAAFALATACPGSIAAGGDADLAVAFAPTAEAELRGALLVTGTGFATGALRIGLHGTGFDQHVALSAMRLDFPDTLRHPTAAASQVVTVRNTGSTELALSAITVDGAAFSLAGPATVALAPGASTELTVTFAPSMIGDFAGHLVLGNADDPQIARVDLAGRGIARDLAIAPLAIDLGSVPVGTTVRLGDLRPDAITIRNADAAPTVLRVTLTGDPAFRPIGPDRTSLGPGDSAKLDLSYAPTAAGAATTQIDVFADGDPDPIARITVAANAVPATSGGGGGGGGAGGGCAIGGGSAGSWPLGLGLALALVALRRRRR